MYHSMNEKCSSVGILADFFLCVVLHSTPYSIHPSTRICIVLYCIEWYVYRVVSLVLWIDRLSVQQHQLSHIFLHISIYTFKLYAYLHLYIRIPHLWFYGCAPVYSFIRSFLRSIDRSFTLSLSISGHCHVLCALCTVQLAGEWLLRLPWWSTAFNNVQLCTVQCLFNKLYQNLNWTMRKRNKRRKAIKI